MPKVMVMGAMRRRSKTPMTMRMADSWVVIDTIKVTTLASNTSPKRIKKIVLRVLASKMASVKLDMCVLSGMWRWVSRRRYAWGGGRLTIVIFLAILKYSLYL